MSPRIYCSFAWYRTRTAAALVASAMLPRVRTGVGCQTHKLPVDFIHVVKFGVIYSVWRLLAYNLPILSAAGGRMVITGEALGGREGGGAR